MKKLIVLILIIVLAISLVACGAVNAETEEPTIEIVSNEPIAETPEQQTATGGSSYAVRETR